MIIVNLGSPFHPKIVDPTRCQLSGGLQPYLERGERIPLMVNKEKHLPFDASRAGPGKVHLAECFELIQESYCLIFLSISSYFSKFNFRFSTKKKSVECVNIIMQLFEKASPLAAL